MSEDPILDYARPRPRQAAGLRRSDYVVASIAAAITFAGFWIFTTLLTLTMLPDYGPAVPVLMWVGLAVAAGVAVWAFRGVLASCGAAYPAANHRP